MAHAHVHTLHAGESLAGAARGALERSGEQWTAMRAAVFDALAGFDRPASAYEVAEAISKAEARRIAANSVYRILDLFVAKNLAQRVESANAYIVNAHPDCSHDCIFLVCDTCKQVTHIDDDSITGQVRGAARKGGFTPRRPIIEVRGFCGACASAA